MAALKEGEKTRVLEQLAGMLKELEPGIEQILKALKLNNLEFASWIGFPIAVMFLIRIGNSVVAFIRKKATSVDGLTAAFGLTYLALNLIGQTRGEVGRLWLFMTPLIALFAATEIAELFKKPRAVTYYIVGLQFITIFVTFRFQDYW